MPTLRAAVSGHAQRPVGRASLGRKHARPACPGQRFAVEDNGGAQMTRYVAPAVYADPVTGAKPDTTVWDGKTGSRCESERPYRVLKKTCEYWGFSAPPPVQEFEGLVSRGFQSMNMARDDHCVVAYLYLVHYRKGNGLPFDKIRSLVLGYRSIADVLVPHTLSPGGVQSLLNDVLRVCCRGNTRRAESMSLEDTAEDVSRRQAFACEEDRIVVCRQARHFASKLGKIVPDTFSVLPRTLAKIAVHLAVQQRGLSAKIIASGDRPYISKKMKGFVKSISEQGAVKIA